MSSAVAKARKSNNCGNPSEGRTSPSGPDSDTMEHIVGRSHEGMKDFNEKSKPQNRTDGEHHCYHILHGLSNEEVLFIRGRDDAL
jgi:hypothetical protein